MKKSSKLHFYIPYINIVWKSLIICLSLNSLMANPNTKYTKLKPTISKHTKGHNTLPKNGHFSKQTEQTELINKIKGYIVNLKNIAIEFEQINPNGKKARGILVLKKPNALSIKYFTPHQDTFTLNHRMLLEYYDSEVRETTELALPHVFDMILFDDFSELKIENIKKKNNRINLIVKYEDSTVEFVFSNNPIELLGWSLKQNNKTIRTEIIEISYFGE